MNGKHTPDPAVLREILLLQGAVQAAPDETRLMETVVHGLTGLPGVADCVLCLEGGIAENGGSYDTHASPGCTLASGMAPASCTDCEDSRITSRKGWERVEVKSSRREFGSLLLNVQDQGAIAPYSGFVGNTASLVALQIENTRRAEELNRLDRVSEELEKNQKIFRDVLDAMPEMVWLKDVDGVYLMCNRGLADLVNSSREKIIGGTDYDIFPQEKADFYRKHDLQAIENRATTINEESADFLQAEYSIWIETSKTPVYDPKGDLIGVLGIGRDISRSKIALQESREEQGFLDQVVDRSPVPMWISSPNGTVLRANQALYSTLNLTAEQVVGKYNPGLDDNLKRADIVEKINLVFHEKQPVKFDLLWKPDLVRGVDFSGARSLHIELSAFPLLGPDGETDHVVVQWVDISERIQEKNMLMMVNEALDNSINGFDIVNSDGVFTYVNKSYLHMWGYESAEEVVGTSPVDHCLDPAQPEKIIHSLKTTGRFEGEFTAKRKDGSTFEAHMYSRLAHDGEGNEIYPTTTIDVTKRKQAERELAEVKTLLSETEKTGKIGGWKVDLETMTQTWTEETYRIHEVDLDFKPDVSKGLDFYDPSSRPIIEKAFNHTVETGEPFDLELEFSTAKGNRIWVHSVGKAKQVDGVTRVVSGSFQDITERKLAEKRLQESEVRFRTICENVPVLIDGFDKNGQCVLWNKQCRETFGWTIDEINEHDDALALFYPDPAVRDEVLQTISDDSSGNFREWHPVTRDGKTVITLWANFQLPDGQVFNLGHDITERRRQENVFLARLRIREFAEKNPLSKLLQACLDEAELLTESKVGFFHFVAEDQVTLELQAWSTHTMEEMCKMGGVKEHYPINEAGVWVECVRTRSSTIHNDYASMANRKGLPEGHAPIIRELVVPVFRDGKIMAILGVGNKECDYDQYDVKVLEEFASLSWDIVLNKRAEEDLKNSEKKFRTIFESNMFGVAFWSRQGGILDGNDAFLGMVGYDKEDILAGSLRWDELTPSELRWRDDTALEEIAEKGFCNPYEKEYICKDGSRTSVILAAASLEERTGQGIVIVLDNSEFKTAELELKNAHALLEQRVEERTVELADRTRQLDHSSRVSTAINDVLREAQKCETEEELGKTCLAAAEILTESKFGFIGELNPKGLMEGIAISNQGWEASDMTVGDARSFIEDMPIRGIDRSTIRDGAPEGHPGITAFLGVPLKYEGKTIGMIGLGNKEGRYELADQEATEALATAIVEALMRKRADIALERRTVEMRDMVNLMAGRENRMAELKKVVRKLRSQLEESGITPVADDPLKSGNGTGWV